MKISDTIAIVTGGSSGIGLETSKQIVAKGGKVLIADLHASPPRFCFENPDVVKYIQTNVTKAGDLLAMFEFAKEVFGAEANVLVNNAGIGDVYPFFAPGGYKSKWEKVIDVDLNAVIRGTGIAVDRW